MLTICPAPEVFVARLWVVAAKAPSTCFRDAKALRCAAESGMSAREDEDREGETLDIDMMPRLYQENLFCPNAFVIC